MWGGGCGEVGMGVVMRNCGCGEVCVWGVGVGVGGGCDCGEVGMDVLRWVWGGGCGCGEVGLVIGR